MFVLANGAFKSGSTWLFNILSATEQFSKVPGQYGRGTNLDWLKPGRIEAFLESGIYRDANYIAKGHHYDKNVRDAFIAQDDVYVFNIKRDIKDSLVSHYFHLIRQDKLSEALAAPEQLKKGFSDYYWRLGRYKAQQLVIYHEVWDVASPRIYVTSFECLKGDFENEMQKIGHFIGLELSAQDVAALKEKTSIQTVQKAKGQDKLPEHKRFYRKGLVGEWQSYFDDKALADVEKIQNEGLGRVDMLKYHAVFKVLDLRRQFAGR